MMDNLLSAFSRLFFWIMVFVLSFTALMFIMQNNHDISLYFDFLKSNSAYKPLITLPVWGFALSLFCLGAVVGASLIWYHLSHLRDALEQEQSSTKKLKGDIDALKNTISKTVS